MPIEPFGSFSPRVHPSAFVHSTASVIGEVEVGEEASIWPSAVLRGDHGLLQIGARTSVQDGSVAHATHGVSVTRIGEHCTVGHRVVLHGCQVGNFCLVGMGSILLDGSELGDFCLLGAGSLVTQNKKFPPRSFLVGSPARRLREVSDAEMEWMGYSWKSYVDLSRQYLSRK